jgi:hypothetical protein
MCMWKFASPRLPHYSPLARMLLPQPCPDEHSGNFTNQFLWLNISITNPGVFMLWKWKWSFGCDQVSLCNCVIWMLTPPSSLSSTTWSWRSCRQACLRECPFPSISLFRWPAFFFSWVKISWSFLLWIQNDPRQMAFGTLCCYHFFVCLFLFPSRLKRYSINICEIKASNHWFVL